MNKFRQLSRSKKILAIVGGVLLLSILCCGMFSLLPSKPDNPTTSPIVKPTEILAKEEIQEKTESIEVATNKPASTNTPHPTDTPAPTETPRPTSTSTATPDPNLFKPGTYLVGTDIKPGLYLGNSNSCYWQRSKDLTGSFDSIIANGNTDGQFYVEIKDSDYAFSIDCPMRLFEQGTEPKIVTDIGPGQYLVGYDILPGLYHGESEGCYWQRSKDFSGSFDSIISNGNTEGQYYVEINDSDFGFAISCPIEPFDKNGEPKIITSLTPGQYLVGHDILPGLYRGNADTDSCYWQRSKDASGGFNSIITNDNATGQFYVEVKDNDFMLTTACILEKAD